MIRLIIFALGIFVIWVLFGSDFSRQKKIIIVIIAFILAILGLWFEQSGEAPQQGRIELSEVQSCGASAEHSYRSNFGVEFCLQNNSATAVAKRVALSFIAQRCVQGRCTELQSVSKEVPLTLAPNSQITLQENLQFDQVDPLDHSIVWTTEVTKVKAVYQ